ncbi:YqaA family protein [Desulfobulbus propionicus]|jgi:membrane protein YqaA with SNARE-associated domain
MKIFSPLYQRAMQWARHPKAPWYLGGLSFMESSFFPIPPDVMLAPMCLGSPKRVWWFVSLTTMASVLGGMFGYAIGFYAFSAIEPLLRSSHSWQTYQTAVEWFGRWGFWTVFIAGFSPIPYKVFTIAAGAMSMTFAPFVLASFIGRGARFLLVGGLMALGGPRMEAVLRKYVDRIGWATVALVVVVVLLYR